MSSATDKRYGRRGGRFVAVRPPDDPWAAVTAWCGCGDRTQAANAQLGHVCSVCSCEIRPGRPKRGEKAAPPAVVQLVPAFTQGELL